MELQVRNTLTKNVTKVNNSMLLNKIEFKKKRKNNNNNDKN